MKRWVLAKSAMVAMTVVAMSGSCLPPPTPPISRGPSQPQYVSSGPPGGYLQPQQAYPEPQQAYPEPQQISLTPPAQPTSTATPTVETAATRDATDRALADAINEYRRQHGLAPVPWSRSLTIVARAHVDDINASGVVGGQCNQHSWSSQSDRWSGCCYTPDHTQSKCMWDKPRELTSYKGSGFEVAVAGGGATLTPAYDIEIWDGSPGHRAVILSEGKWDKPWRALGCAHSATQAVCWFGNDVDPN